MILYLKPLCLWNTQTSESERERERAKVEADRSYITCTETAQLSILFRVSTGLTASSLWGWGRCLSAGADPDLHTSSIFPSTSSFYCWTPRASFMLLPPSSLKLLSLKNKASKRVPLKVSAYIRKVNFTIYASKFNKLRFKKIFIIRYCQKPLHF